MKGWSFSGAGSFLMLFGCWAVVAQAQSTIKLVISAEFGVPNSTSAQSISAGARIAADEINAAGGLLGRKLEVIEMDNRAVPALANKHILQVATDPDVVAVMAGRFSPVVVEALEVVHKNGMPFLAPWSAADSIVDNGFQPNYVFRYSVRDSWAFEVMLRECERRGLKSVALLLPNTEWGRSSSKAAEAYVERSSPRSRGKALTISSKHWFSWGEESLIEKYKAAVDAGADAVLFVTNDREGAILVQELAARPEVKRLPIFSHWGITGGKFFEKAGAGLMQLDWSVIQSFTFLNNTTPKAKSFMKALEQLGYSADPRLLPSPVGLANAYDLTHLLAMAVRKAGSLDRAKIRDAMEHLGPYKGLVTSTARPFTPQRHEGLSRSNVFLAKYAPDGALEAVRK